MFCRYNTPIGMGCCCDNCNLPGYCTPTQKLRMKNIQLLWNQCFMLNWKLSLFTGYTSYVIIKNNHDIIICNERIQ